ncbi:MAG TPA: hypothetical protein VF762_20015, partial [Blastocatellia bacterium]
MRIPRILLPVYLMIALAAAPVPAFAQEEKRAEKSAASKARREEANKSQDEAGKPQAETRKDEPKKD